VEPRYEVWFVKEGVLEQTLDGEGLPQQWEEPELAHAVAKAMTKQEGVTVAYVVQRMVVGTYHGGG